MKTCVLPVSKDGYQEGCSEKAQKTLANIIGNQIKSLLSIKFDFDQWMDLAFQGEMTTIRGLLPKTIKNKEKIYSLDVVQVKDIEVKLSELFFYWMINQKRVPQSA